MDSQGLFPIIGIDLLEFSVDDALNFCGIFIRKRAAVFKQGMRRKYLENRNANALTLLKSDNWR